MTAALIATTPNAMVAAQAQLIGWMDKKLAELEAERKEAEALLAQLRLARAATTHADKVMNSVRRRERFYEKVRAALDAGYYIIPPFDCQVFAIRTDRDTPPAQITQNRDTWNPPPGMPALPPGQGHYVNALPDRSFDHSVERPAHHDPSKTTVDKFYSNDAWREVEFPMRAMKPELIEATREAMEAKIFDAFAIAPQYRAADPIIVGQIRHWKSNRTPLTFFVAWWIEEKDL